MALLCLTLRMSKAREGNDAMLYDSGVPDKDHIRKSLLSGNQANVCEPLELAVQLLPLGKCEITRRSMEISGHPWIDDVVYVVPLRWTHQVGWPIEVWEGREIASRR
jgi:hypothetical protein